MAILVPNFELAEKIGKQVEIDAATVAELVEVGSARYGDEFRKTVKTAIIVVNGRAISLLAGMRTPLGSKDQVWFVRPAGGG
jgi:molybdopterin converting factor small subunit